MLLLVDEVVNVGQKRREDAVSVAIPYIRSSSVHIPFHDLGWNLSNMVTVIRSSDIKTVLSPDGSSYWDHQQSQER